MDKLGLQLPLLVAQVINFAILFIILNKFLYKPILKKLDERKQKIAQGLALTDSLKRQEETAAQHQADLLKKAKADAAKLLAEAKKTAQEEKDHLLAQGRQELAVERARLTTEMEHTLQVNQKALSQKTVEIAAVMAGQVLTDLLDQDKHHQLIAKSLAKLKSTHVS